VVLRSRGPKIFTFLVTGVVKEGWRYDPSQNVETSDSINYR
jgi:hypothetical protein